MVRQETIETTPLALESGRRLQKTPLRNQQNLRPPGGSKAKQRYKESSYLWAIKMCVVACRRSTKSTSNGADKGRCLLRREQCQPPRHAYMMRVPPKKETPCNAAQHCRCHPVGLQQVAAIRAVNHTVREFGGGTSWNFGPLFAQGVYRGTRAAWHSVA